MSTKIILGFSALSTASSTAYLNTMAGIPIGTTVLTSMAAGLFGAGVSWATMQGAVRRAQEKADTAHARISAEKVDRKESILELKRDMERGFDRMAETAESQTNVLLAAIQSAVNSRKES